MALKFPDPSFGSTPDIGRLQEARPNVGGPIAAGGESLGHSVEQGGMATAKAVATGGVGEGEAVSSAGQMLSRAMARAGEMLGQGWTAFGKGISNLGEGVADFGLDRNRWNYAQAHSQFLTSTLDLDSQYSHDTDYTTLPQRFTTDLTAARETAAGTIDDPRMRDRFLMTTQPDFVRAQAKINGRALDLQGQNAQVDVNNAGQDLINKGAAANDDSLDAKIAKAHADSIDGLAAAGFISPLQAQSMKQQWAQQYVTAKGIADVNSGDPGRILNFMNTLRAKPTSDDAIVNRMLGAEGTSKNPASSAYGTGQFLDKTWLQMVKTYRPDLANGQSDQSILAMRADPRLGRQMTQAYMQENRQALMGAGAPATPGNLYLAHFLGAGAAAAVIKADPGQPISRVLYNFYSQQPGYTPERAQATVQNIVASNAGVLLGKQTGTVREWADGKMGGVAVGGGSLYDILPVAQRALLFDRAQAAYNGLQVGQQSNIRDRVGDTEAEAMNTGIAKNPVTQSEFISALGPQLGITAHQQYTARLSFAADFNKVATLTPAEQQETLTRYAPAAGADGYADQLKRYQQLEAAVRYSNEQKASDPAGFAVTHLPASKDAWQAFSAKLQDPKATDADRQAAARDYAGKTTIEQERVGVQPDAVRVVPKNYIDTLSKQLSTAASSDDPQRRIGLVGQIQHEAQMWGNDYWPQVMREVAPTSQPLVRAIAAGADTSAMTRLLSLSKDETAEKMLKEQTATKAKDLNDQITDAMAPFRQSMVGRQVDRDYDGYYGLAQKLGALYVRDGLDAKSAAAKAFNDLIGNRYEFRDTWRIPKGGQQPAADDVQAGTVAARETLAASAAANLLGQAREQYPILAKSDYGYVEKIRPNAGYLEHWAPGEPGAPSAPGSLDGPRPAELPLNQPGLEIRDARTRTIDVLGDIVSHNLVNTDPVVKGYYDGLRNSLTSGQQDILKDQYQHAQQHEGEKRSFDEWKEASGLPGLFRGYAFQQWPKDFTDKAYTPAQRAGFDQMVAYLKSGAGPLADIKPAIDDMGRGTANRGDTLRAIARDGKFVTANDNSGLNLVYADKLVRDRTGKPIELSWVQLAGMGHARAAAQAASPAAAISVAP